jgi:hypothetical protein
MNPDKPLKNQRFLSFGVQRRIVKAMFQWGHFWGHPFQKLGAFWPQTL